MFSPRDEATMHAFIAACVNAGRTRVKRGRGQRRNRRTHCSFSSPCKSCRKQAAYDLLRGRR